MLVLFLSLFLRAIGKYLSRLRLVPRNVITVLTVLQDEQSLIIC